MNARDAGPGRRLTSARPGGSLTTENWVAAAQRPQVGEHWGVEADPGEHEAHEAHEAGLGAAYLYYISLSLSDVPSLRVSTGCRAGCLHLTGAHWCPDLVPGRSLLTLSTFPRPHQPQPSSAHSRHSEAFLTEIPRSNQTSRWYKTWTLLTEPSTGTGITQWFHVNNKC